MTSDEIEAIATRASHKTLEGFFQRIGVDTSDPFELQKDFAHLRSWRTAIAETKRRSLLAIVTVLVTGFLGMVFAIVTHKFS